MSRFVPLTVRNIRRETADCVSIALDVPDTAREAFRFRPGQHLVLKREIHGEELRRTYSICTGIGEEIRIAVKRQPQGRFSTYLNEHLLAGEVIEAMPPAGRFFTELDSAMSRRYVAFASGSGITPIMSILRSVLVEEPGSHFLLVYGNRTASSIIFREELEDLKNRYMDRLSVVHVLSGEAQELPVNAGRINAEKVARICQTIAPPGEVHAWYVCGPAPMIQTVSEALAGEGVERDRIRFEYFTTEGNQPRAKPALAPAIEATGDSARLEIVLDGQRAGLRIAYNDVSVLEAARRHGLDVPFSCTAGVCCTCRARLVEGEVDMAANYALEDWELERGYILTCQARPLTGRLVVDYDQS